MLDALRAAGEVNAEDYDRAQHGLLGARLRGASRLASAARALRRWPKVAMLMNAARQPLQAVARSLCPEPT